MNAREERGLVISATKKLVQKGKIWLVPSQGSNVKYTVCPDHDTPYCSCPDHEETGLACKHVYAARFTMQREQGANGVVTETRTLTITQKKTYKKPEWGVYNLGQCEEKRRFLTLLHDLCRGLPNPPQNRKGGRERSEMSDMAFTCIYKVFSTVSGRRFSTDLDEAFGKGLLTRRINGMMAWPWMEHKDMTPVLQDLLVRSSLPLRAIETTFAPDSTGFSTSRFDKWFDIKYNDMRTGRSWCKAHCMAGTKTHVITAVEILDKDAADCPQFKPLVETTAKNFDVKEVVADKAYLSRENLMQIHEMGGTAFIPFKSNSVPGEPGTVWEKMYHFYHLHRDEFDAKYHQRSQAESVFSMVKAKFLDGIRSRTDVAQKNEVLAKCIAHNICCLIMSQLELGIDVQFWGERIEAADVKTAVPVADESAVAATQGAVCVGPWG